MGWSKKRACRQPRYHATCPANSRGFHWVRLPRRQPPLPLQVSQPGWMAVSCFPPCRFDSWRQWSQRTCSKVVRCRPMRRRPDSLLPQESHPAAARTWHLPACRHLHQASSLRLVPTTPALPMPLLDQLTQEMVFLQLWKYRPPLTCAERPPEASRRPRCPKARNRQRVFPWILRSVRKKNSALLVGQSWQYRDYPVWG